MSPAGRELLEYQKQDLVRLAAEFEKKTRVTWAELVGTGRHPAISHPRQDFMLLLHDNRWSFTDIGKALGRNHTSVMYGVNRARERRRLRLMREARAR